MGMSESIDDLYLLDFVLKDRDRFLIVFSGTHYLIKVLFMQEMQAKSRDKVLIIISNLPNVR